MNIFKFLFMNIFFILIMNNNHNHKRKYIDKGYYGIVIKSGFDNHDNKETIAKLFLYKEEYKKEIERHKIISDIDKDFKFTVRLLNHSQININDIDVDFDIYSHYNLNKNLKRNKNKILYQITYEYGGVGLHKLFKDISLSIPLNTFIGLFKGLFEAIKILNENGVIHSDIKMSNILYNENQNRLILIDYSFFDYNEDEYFIFKDNDILHLPSELKIVNNNHNKNEFNLILFLNSIEKLIDTNHIYINKIRELNAYLIKELDNYRKFKVIPNKIDIYQLGLVLYQIVILNPSEEIDITIFDIIRKMIEPNPSKRTVP